jgi:subtilisin family serine protease
MDVLNLSLGGGYHGNNDLLAIGLDNAVDAGVVVAVAAGNSGPGQGTLESPGRARKIITVAASTNRHFVGQPFTYPAGGGTTIGAAVGDFDPLPAATFTLFDTHSDGCTSVDPAAAGSVAIIDRGGCVFSQKVANAKAAGAIGVVIINNVAGDPTAMARTAGFDDDLPAVMISKNDGAALRAANPPDASALATFQEFITPNQDILAGFSSQGPTLVDFAVKPDVTSVGVNVLSSITCVGTGFPCTTTGDGTDAPWAFFSGTSMATPHIAGSAAVLLQLHSDWSPAQVKSALVNRADLVIKDAITGTHDVGPTAQGTGRENLSVAADATTWMDPVSASFGRVTVGRGSSVTITLHNPTGTPQTFAVSKLKFTPSTFGNTVPLAYNAGDITMGDDRISVPASVTVPAQGSTTLRVTVNAAMGTTVQGWINLDGPLDNDLHFAYYAHVGP